MEENKLQPMGLGKLANPNNIHVMKFRWRLISDKFPSEIVSKIKIDYKLKKLELTLRDVVFEDSAFDALKWIELCEEKARKCEKQTLKLVTYDGCGQELYITEFTGVLSVRQHEVEFDYASSETIERKITLVYDHHETKYLFEPQPKFKLTNCSKLKPIKPSLPLSIPHWEMEAELNSGGTDTVVIKKHKISNIKKPESDGIEPSVLSIKIDRNNIVDFESVLLDSDLIVKLYLYNDQKLLEEWRLYGSSIDVKQGIVYFKNCSYHPGKK